MCIIDPSHPRAAVWHMQAEVEQRSLLPLENDTAITAPMFSSHPQRSARTTTSSTDFMNRSIEIGVVGGGASAVCLLDVLAEAELVPGGITVFEPSVHPWRGRPFQPDVETVRVNLPPDRMSLRVGDTAHFERYLATRDVSARSLTDYTDPFCDARFVPRALFGDYLEQSALAALSRLRDRGWRINLVRERVDIAIPDGNRVMLETEHARRVTVDHTVLCVGSGPPNDPYRLAGSPNFVTDPYPLSRTLVGIDTEEEVGVIGSGLTAVDVILTLAARGHQGRLRLLSRSGVLPGVRQRPISYTLRHFTPERFRAAAARNETVTLDELIATMGTELADASENLASVAVEIAAIGKENPVRLLRRHLAEVNSSSLSLRILQRAMRATGPDVWPLLAEREKIELLRRHYRTVMSLCSPMPPASAAKILELVDSGQLEIVSGVRIIKASTDGGFTIVADGGKCTASHLINAVNAPGHKIPPMAERLIASLIAAGVADRHPLGGLQVDRATSRLIARGKADPRLYALGDLAAGSLFFTFSLPLLLDRAYDIVHALLDHTHTRQGDSSIA